MLADKTIPLAEVAAALGRSEDWLMRNWLRLHQRDGFPRRLPAGWVWPRRLVEAWIDAGGAAPQPAPTANDNAAGADLVALQRAALHQRYGVTR